MGLYGSPQVGKFGDQQTDIPESPGLVCCPKCGAFFVGTFCPICKTHFSNRQLKSVAKLKREYARNALISKTGRIIRKIIIGLCVITAFSVVIYLGLKIYITNTAKYITAEEYRDISEGMTYAQVCDIIGSSGQLTQEFNLSDEFGWNYKYYIWYENADETSFVVIVFNDNNVLMKYQTGLE